MTQACSEVGFHDAEWAYSIGRPLAETAVLAALAHRTDDATHETIAGQETVARMLGSSPEKVRRGLSALERAGVITRSRRHGRGGYRTSDLITLNVETYRAESPQGKTPTGQNAHQENRGRLPDESRPPTGRKVPAEEINQSYQPEDQPAARREPRTADEDTSPADHPNLAHARRALTELRSDRRLPLAIDELILHAARLGHGDPWAGYLEIKLRTEAAIVGARSPRAVLLKRLEEPAPPPPKYPAREVVG
jgi:hypothetical protein